MGDLSDSVLKKSVGGQGQILGTQMGLRTGVFFTSPILL